MYCSIGIPRYLLTTWAVYTKQIDLPIILTYLASAHYFLLRTWYMTIAAYLPRYVYMISG